ncbi:MAG: hypothetical protein E7513_01700 [Ruminococcaceae bacterium]|nr:hypothetical protein [Oscillospiraceae bacterium]
MGNKNLKKKNSASNKKARLAAKKYARALAFQKNITIFALLILLVVGLVSTTFASFIPGNTDEAGSLIADIQTLAISQGHKNDLADTKANVDLAEQSATRTYVSGEYIYLENFVPSGWGSTTWILNNSYAYAYMWGGTAGTHSYLFELYQGTAGAAGAIYRAKVTNAGTYTNVIFTRNSAVGGPFSNVWNQTGDLVFSETSNCYYGFTSGGTSRNSKIYAVKPASVTASVTNAVSGTGTSTDPYIVRPGASYSVKLTATKDDEGMEGFGWNINSSSSKASSSTSNTYTKSYTAGTTDGALSTYVGYAWCYEGSTSNYSSSYATSNTVYVKVMAEPFATNDTIYFDCRNSTTWASSTVYVQCNNSTTNSGTRAQMTQIGTYLYKYTFTSTTAPLSGNVRIWSGTRYSGLIAKSTYSTSNGIYVSSTTSGSGTLAKFAIGTVNTPTLTVSDNDITYGDSTTLTSSTAVLNYTRAGTSYTTTPVGATYTFKSGSTSLNASSNTTYSWKPSACGTYSVTVQVTSTAAGVTSSASSAKTVTVRPTDPGAVTITGTNTISGTGTSDDPFIVYENNSFALNASIPTPTPSTAVAHYSNSATGTYTATNTFNPSTSTKGTTQTYSIYAKTIANSVYSANYSSATAYYMAFTSLDGGNTGFTMSSDSIDDTQSITFSDAYVNGIADAEKTYITQSYQISSDNAAFTDISGDTWTPDSTGNYYFRVKTTNTKTGQVVYSTSQMVTVTQSTVYYNITVVRASGSSTAGATLKTDGTTITDNKILSNEPLTVSLARTNATPSNYYFKYITVTDGVNSWEVSDLNGDLTETLVIDHVKGNVTIEYYTTIKPLVQPNVPANSASMSFKYMSDGVEKIASTAANYYVDYNSSITYTVTPKTGYYVKSMTGVTMGAMSASTTSGTKNNITANVGAVTATLSNNNTVTVNIDTTSATSEGASMTVDGAAVDFGVPKPLNYGAQATVVITPPENYYAVVSGSSVQSTISTDGKATFKVTLTGSNKSYTVKFVPNPKIYMVQPLHGSVYVTDGAGNYYFNGDFVGYGTELTVHAKPDHSNAVLNQVLINNASIGTADGSKFKIYSDSTATANISVDSKFSFDNDDGTVNITDYSYRRIFYTDNAGWGDKEVIVHYSNSSSDTDFSKNNVAMTYKYTNDMNQRVYTADIPFSAKYVNFVKKSDDTKYSASALIDNEHNAFYISTGSVPYAIHYWNMNYSDYIATDRADTIQQGMTSKNEPVTFEYTCDYGDGTLSAQVVAGNNITYDFDKGTLSITPTESTYNYSLVKVTSAASTTVKYYLIKVENFEIISFSGLQKIYRTNVFNNIQLDLIVSGGVLDYAANYMVSDTNAADSFTQLTDGTSSGFTQIDSVQGYINSFLINYAVDSISTKYFKVEASDAAGHKGTKTLKTLFGTNTYEGERSLYFYNNTSVNLSKFNLRACFYNNQNDYTWATMQRVGETDYYRATIPNGFEKEVSFYLCNPKTFSNNPQDMNSTEFCSFGVIGAEIPTVENSNIVYEAIVIGEPDGISGQFVEFDY